MPKKVLFVLRDGEYAICGSRSVLETDRLLAELAVPDSLSDLLGNDFHLWLAVDVFRVFHKGKKCLVQRLAEGLRVASFSADLIALLRMTAVAARDARRSASDTLVLRASAAPTEPKPVVHLTAEQIIDAVLLTDDPAPEPPTPAAAG